MTEEEINKISKKHIKAMNKNNPQAEIMNWVESIPLKTNTGFYFDYKFELLNPDNPFSFGGAPGYFIDQETGELRNLSWQELRTIKKTLS